jgi:hypothetical protein
MALEMKMPHPPQTISIVGPELSLQFHPGGTNGEVVSRSPYTLGL